jgi:hypothetical protein
VDVDTLQRAQVTAWREGFALAGVVVAAALPALRQAARDGDAERSLAAENLIRRIRPPWSRE